MFDHSQIRKYDFADVPLNQDIFLMDEKWASQYEKALVRMFNGGEYANVGYISYAAARGVRKSSIDLSWYPNISDRFHEVSVTLPRDQFVTCIDCPNYDDKPRIFVRGGWLRNLHLRAYSVFAIVDAIGVKNALASGQLTRRKLINLRRRIDKIAKRYPAISFVSFADSLLIKSNWFVGQYDSHIKYTYAPEVVIRLIADIRSAYLDVLGMEIYAVLTQGSNEYYDDALLHISSTQNHISLNSLGLPFAQLMSIDDAARRAIRDHVHGPAELYMDKNFYHSLNFVHGFGKNTRPKHRYHSRMSTEDSFYFYSDYQTIMDNLTPPKKKAAPRRSKKGQP
jgi:hypothetical protein